MDNSRSSGERTPAMGNVSINDIRFHPDSRMTMYTRWPLRRRHPASLLLRMIRV
ncbi:MAG: hypothetical protein JJ867_15020, partial [Marinobacter sp.]|nr:hypothetical protein [Marinobacter sp.]